MIKLSASIQKKLPIENLEYSSQSYSAGMEIELADRTGKEELKEKIRKLYGLLGEAIDQQIQSHVGERKAKKQISQRARQNSGEGSRNGRSNDRKATRAQIKAIHAISKDRGMAREELTDHLREVFKVESTAELTVSEASELIDMLKKSGKEEPS